MTQNEFQQRYHGYLVSSEREAQAEADKVNAEGIEGDEAVPVTFTGQFWCLMLKSAYLYMMDLQ